MQAFWIVEDIEQNLEHVVQLSACKIGEPAARTLNGHANTIDVYSSF